VTSKPPVITHPDMRQRTLLLKSAKQFAMKNKVKFVNSLLFSISIAAHTIEAVNLFGTVSIHVQCKDVTI